MFWLNNLFQDNPVVSIVATAAVVFLLLYIQHKGTLMLDIPRIGKSPHRLFGLGIYGARADFMRNGRRLVEEGYEKYKNSLYVIQTADMERIIVSPKYLDELRSYPGSVLSVREALCERHLASWNTLDVVNTSNLHVDVVRVQLGKNSGALFPKLADEAIFGWEEAIKKHAASKDGFVYATTNSLAYSVVAQTINRAIVGVPTCRNEEWHQLTIAYATDAFGISGILRPLPNFVRYIVFPFLGTRKRLQKTIHRANEILVPVIEAHQAGKGDGLDLLQWMILGAKGNDKKPTELVRKVLFLTLASIVSSAMTITHAIFDLCVYPEYIKPLREEIEAVLEREGGWTLQGIDTMDLLDSFLKESQRINHPGLFSFNRKVRKNIQLSDGSLLPKGSFISVPTYSTARDPAYFDSSVENFEPFRFFKMRKKLSTPNSNEHVFSSVSPSSLGFGYGAYACPGRFFASRELKVLLATLLMYYDFKFPDEQIERPENIYVDERIWPSRTQKVGFRPLKK